MTRNHTLKLTKMLGTTLMARLPNCDICEREGRSPPEPAKYDAKTTLGPTAYMCQEHFNEYGTPLGTQLIKSDAKEPYERVKKADALCRRCGKGCDPNTGWKEEYRFKLLGNRDAIGVMLDAGLYCDEASSMF